MFEFYFDIRDIFKVPRAAFSIRRIAVHFRALVVAFFVYDVFSYVGLAISGISFTSAFSRYYLFPPILSFIAESAQISPAGVIIQLVGIFLFILINYIAGAAVAKITLEQLRGNSFYTAKESWAFVRRNWLAVITPPVIIFLFVSILIGVVLLFGAIGLIPFVGEFLVSLTVFPSYFIGLSILLFVVIGFFGFALTPAIVGSAGGDTFETTFELFSTVTNKPLRLIVYETVHTLFSALCTMVFAIVSILGIWISISFLTVVMGSKFLAIFSLAWGMLPSFVKFLFSSHFLGGALSWVKPGYIEFAGLPGVWDIIVSTVFVFGLYAIIGVIVAYALSVHNVGQTIIYIILRKNKDDENLLEAFDAEYEEALMREAAQATAEIKLRREKEDEKNS